MFDVRRSSVYRSTFVCLPFVCFKLTQLPPEYIVKAMKRVTMVLNEKQKKRIADILTDTGKIIFATSVIAPFFQQFKINPILVVLGFIISIAVYLLAIFIEKEA